MKLDRDKRERLARGVLAEVDRWNEIEDKEGFVLHREILYREDVTSIFYEKPAYADRAAVQFEVTIR